MKRRVLVVVLATTLWGACDTAPEMAAITLPDLSRSDPSVRSAITEAHHRLEDQLEARGSDDELAAAFGELAETCHAHEFPSCAATSYTAAERLEPDNVRWPYLRGRLLVDLGEPDAALIPLGRAVELDLSENVGPRLTRASAALAAGRPEVATADYEVVLGLSPRDPVALYRSGLVALDHGDLDRATARLTGALQAAPQADAIHHALARLARARGDDDEARRHARIAGNRLPEAPDPLVDQMQRRRRGTHNLANRAQSEVMAGQLNEAVATYRQLLRLDPADIHSRGNLGSVLVRLRRFDAARRELEAVLESSPDDVAASYNLGTLELIQDRPSEASIHLERALGIDPHHARAWLNLGAASWAIGDLAAAEEAFDRVATLEPANSLAIQWQVAIDVRRDRPDRALRRIDEALRRVESVHLQADRVRVMATVEATGLPDPQRAWSEASKLEDELITSTDPAAWDAVRSLAMAAAASGRFDRAIDLQARAIGLATRAVAGAPLEELRSELHGYRERQPLRLAWWRPRGIVESRESPSDGP